MSLRAGKSILREGTAEGALEVGVEHQAESPVGLPEGVEGSRVGPSEFWIRVWSYTPAPGKGVVRAGAEVVVQRGGGPQPGEAAVT